MLALEELALAQAHDPQAGGDRADTGGEDGTNQEDLRMAPDPPGEEGDERRDGGAHSWWEEV